jgi:hypothetical protein
MLVAMMSRILGPPPSGHPVPDRVCAFIDAMTTAYTDTSEIGKGEERRKGTGTG